jgi:protein CMS1
MSHNQPAKPAGLASKGKLKPKKRAREDEGGPRKRVKPAFEEDLDLDLEAGLNKKIAYLDGMLLADHLAQKTRRFGTDLTPVELSALDISREFFNENEIW